MAKRIGFQLLLLTACLSPAYHAAFSQPPPASTAVVSRQPDGMILSTGNLYFTSHDAAGAAVWRTAQDSVPGQEHVIYWEAGAVFGDIAFAKIGNDFFGYFFVRSAGTANVVIKRIPLAGGNAITLGSVGSNIDIVNTHHNLVTDGLSLYWQDVDSIRKMPIGGGVSTVLDQARPNTPTAGIALQRNNIIYASVSDIRFVPTTGAVTIPQVRTIATASSRVTALAAVANGVYWGENDGAVRLKAGTTITTLESSQTLLTLSISADGVGSGVRQAWAKCIGPSCSLVFASSSVQSSEPIAANALGVTVTPSGIVFWGDATGVHRQPF